MKYVRLSFICDHETDHNFLKIIKPTMNYYQFTTGKPLKSWSWNRQKKLTIIKPTMNYCRSRKWVSTVDLAPFYYWETAENHESDHHWLRIIDRPSILVLKIMKPTTNYDATGSTAILMIVEGREIAFQCFLYQFTTGKPLKNLKLTLEYYATGSRTNIVEFLFARVQMSLNTKLSIVEANETNVIQRLWTGWNFL